MVEICARALDAAGNAYISANERTGRFGTGEANVGWADIPSEVFVRAVMDELWSRIDLALLDFDARDPDGWARGHEHAKSVVRGYLSTALSQPNEEGEAK